jgi:hypothetical protein
MKRLMLSAVAFATAATFAPGIAQATPADGPSGLLCGFTSTTDPGTEGGDVQTGELDAGPLTAIDDTATPPTPPTPQSGTVKCTIQVGGSTHAAPDNGASASASGTGVIVLPATLVSYNSPPNVPVYLCTQFTYSDGRTVYFDDPNDPTVDGNWDTDPNVDCGLATEVSSPPPPPPSPVQTYVAGGTGVVSNDNTAALGNTTVVDAGVLVCDPSDAVGIGGVCLPWGGLNAGVKVTDAVSGLDVPFQVCIDNSADGVCTPGQTGTCADTFVFSHGPGTVFHNPLAVPSGFKPGCGSALPNADTWDGYVVFPCQGVHNLDHVHVSTVGTAEVTTTADRATGTFCGGSPGGTNLVVPPKLYLVL